MEILSIFINQTILNWRVNKTIWLVRYLHNIYIKYRLNKINKEAHVCRTLFVSYIWTDERRRRRRVFFIAQDALHVQLAPCKIFIIYSNVAPAVQKHIGRQRRTASNIVAPPPLPPGRCLMTPPTHFIILFWLF